MKWAITLVIFFGVPVAFVWAFMPYLDISHATYLAAQGDYALAVRALNRAIRFNPSLAEAYTRRGWLYAKLGDYDKALADCNHSLSMNDSQWDAYNNRAWVRLQIGGDLKQALDDAGQAVALFPGCAQAYDTRGMIELKMNETDRALSDFDRAVSLDEKFAEAFAHRSLCEQRLNQTDKAGADLRRARELGLITASDSG